MTTFPGAPARRQTLRMSAIALAIGTLAAPAFAQEDPTKLDAVVVTGFRASLNNALNQKKNADGLVDVIKAEDVSKFPDANLAESLQRVPGVALARGDGGEGKQITVRGLNAGFTRVRINGIEAISATGASDINGSTNRSRAFDFSVFAAELFNSLSVRKTSQADVEEGSLGATVDLRGARPFDFREQTLTFGAQSNYNTLARNSAPRLTGLFTTSAQTDIGKIGILMSAAWSKRSATEEGYEAVELLPASDGGSGFCSPVGFTPQNPANNPVKGIDANNCGVNLPRTSNLAAYQNVFGRTDNFGGTVANPAAGSGAFHPRIPRYRRSVAEYERLGVTAALQWRPSAATEVNLDVLGGTFDNSRYDNYISAISFGRPLGSNGKPMTSIVEASFNSNGSWEYGKFNGVDVRSEGLIDVNNTTFKQHVLSATHKLTDTIKLDVMTGISDSRLDSPMRATVQLDIPNVNGFSFDFRQNRNVPTLTFGTDVANPANYSFAPTDADGTVRGGFVGRVLNTGNKLRTNAVGGSWEVSENITLRSGLSSRKNVWDNFEVGSGTQNGLANPPGFQIASVTRMISNFGKGLEGSGYPSQWVAVDLPKFLKVWDIEAHSPSIPGSQLNLLGQSNRKILEKIDAAYLSADFNYDVGPVMLRGNVGVRATETKANASALVNVNGTLQPVSFDKTYRDTLPSFNLTAELPRDVFLRFSASKTLSRPEYADLAPTASVNTNAQTVSIGAPNLDPVRADTYDLQAEWYFAKNSLVSLGVFHKKIDSYIQRVTERVAYNTLGLPDALLTGGGTCTITGTNPTCATLPSSIVTVGRAANTPGGPLTGFEANVQLPFSFLPGIWSNFGMLANITHVKSTINYITRTATPTLPQLSINANLVGMSPRASNLTLYYEDSKFSARVSAAYRSKYLINVLGDVNGHDVSFVNASTNIDFSASYNVSPKLKVTFEAANLTNQALRYGRDSQRDDTWLYAQFGRTFGLGMQYKF